MTDIDGPAARPHVPPSPEPGSVLAETARLVRAGAPALVVASAPGAGKTTMITRLVDVLAGPDGPSIEIACATTRATLDMAGRLADRLGLPRPDAGIGVEYYAAASGLPAGVDAKGTCRAPVRILVRTVASALASPSAVDVFVVDEAWQVTWADLSVAAQYARQLVLVGDPGQIGPVTTIDTTPWAGIRAAPHLPAPQVVLGWPHTYRLHMGTTYRLGPATTEAIAPLYDFPIDSKRPLRTLVRSGRAVGEITSTRIPAADGPADVAPMRACVGLAGSYVGVTLVTRDSDGAWAESEVGASDIAVLAAHNVQVDGMLALLADAGLGEVSVGTADRMQGGQWPVVVSLDPTVGHHTVSAHQLSPGRLCVMASRHMTHLHWVHDASWRRTLAASPDPEARLGREVRRRMRLS